MQYAEQIQQIEYIYISFYISIYLVYIHNIILNSSRGLRGIWSFRFCWPFENTAPVDKSVTNPAKRLSAATSGPSKTLHLSTNPSKWPSKTLRLSTNPRKRLGCARGSKTPHLPTNPAKRLSGATSGPSKTQHLSANPRKSPSKNIAPVDKSEVKVIENVQLSQNPRTRLRKTVQKVQL